MNAENEMKIELHEIKICDMFSGYKNNDEEGVTAYSDKLNIRPKYQREFVYNAVQQKAVIDTVLKGYPLNVMYWIDIGNGDYEILDGQQRTLSICEFLSNKFFIDYKGDQMKFFSLSDETQKKILDYPLMVYFCTGGTEEERLDWFETINIAGEKLTPQELRNSVYTGEWLTDAKYKFSKTNCKAYKTGSKYMGGKKPIRQEYLETVLDWISARDYTGTEVANNADKRIKRYMAEHRYCENASELYQYFEEVINWVERRFPDHDKYLKEMSGLPWGLFHNKYCNDNYNADNDSKRIAELMANPEIQSKKGIFEYILSGSEKSLNLRTFDDATKRTVYEQQKEICPICKQHFELNEMEGDHITPWHKGGRTVIENCQMLCVKCNREKGGK